MKRSGFTLVELLAVILILAIIALIAVPQILNIITEAKKEAIRVSANNYIRAVNTSLISNELNNNIMDGVYTITNNGKTIKYRGKEINIEFDGKGLTEGYLVINNSKVSKVLNGKIDKYYAILNNDDITLNYEENASTLIKGIDFNVKIKRLAGDGNENYNTKNTNIKNIEILSEGKMPNGYTKEKLIKLKNTSVSDDNKIKAYYDDNGNMFIYSDNYIFANEDSQMMFQYMELNKIDFNNLDTSKVKLLNHFLSYSGNKSNIETLDLSNFDTYNVTNMRGMFYQLNVKNIIFGEKFVTDNVTTFEAMFQGVSSLKSVDLRNFNTSKVTTFWRMFYQSSVSEITVSKNKWIINEKATTGDEAFKGITIKYV